MCLDSIGMYFNGYMILFIFLGGTIGYALFAVRPFALRRTFGSELTPFSSAPSATSPHRTRRATPLPEGESVAESFPCFFIFLFSSA